MTYPVAEIFPSIQGEGLWAGVPMTFIRLAGCNVGKPYTHEAQRSLALMPYQERCTDWSGNSFPCDTNYRKAGNYTVDALMAREDVSSARRVCITGGEPFLHDLMPLVDALVAAKKYVHIETSGTLHIPAAIARRSWIVMSPKAGYISESLTIADEVKVLVGTDFDEDKFVEAFGHLFDSNRLLISPVSDEHSLRKDTMARCMELCQKYKGIRLTLQLHKILCVR